MILSILPGAALSVAPGFVCLMLWRRTREARAQLLQARENDAFATRTLRLVAQELQETALSLRGRAGLLAAERHDMAPDLAVAAAQLGDLADEISHDLIAEPSPHALSCEVVSLVALVGDAVSCLQDTISPGRRHWRIGGLGAQDVAVWADRRALLLVLVRVLGEAVRSSAQDDWVEIGWVATENGLVIRIEDEGVGMASPAAQASSIGPSHGVQSKTGQPQQGCAPMDSRGIGFRLALARKLTQAHGGFLEVEALARIGTRVTITLPADRLRRPVRAAPIPMTGTFTAAHHINPIA